MGRRFQASNFKANIAYLSKEIMISDVIVVNAHTKTEIGAITDQLLTAHNGGRFAIFYIEKKITWNNSFPLDFIYLKKKKFRIDKWKFKTFITQIYILFFFWVVTLTKSKIKVEYPTLVIEEVDGENNHKIKLDIFKCRTKNVSR